MDRKLITIREKSYADDMALDPYDTGEATRKQVYTYIFTDFIRGSMIVGFLFLDAFMLADVWYLFPNLTSLMNETLSLFGGLNMVFLYYIVGMLFLIFELTRYEGRLYRNVRKRLSEVTQTD